MTQKVRDSIFILIVTAVKSRVKTVSSFISPLSKVNNHPDEVDSKVVIAYGLVSKELVG